MDLIVEPEAEDDLKQFDKEHQQYILDRLQELEEKTTGHKDSETIRVQGRTVFKYVMKEGIRGGKDFRAVYDVRNSEIRVVAVLHRDEGYDKEKLSERL
jgi:mRNA-degrading endonuclease RelE of RelBE toxin-antitoxin system